MKTGRRSEHGSRPNKAWLERSYLDRSTADGDTWTLSYIYPDNHHSRISGTEVPDSCPVTSCWSLKNRQSKPDGGALRLCWQQRGPWR